MRTLSEGCSEPSPIHSGSSASDAPVDDLDLRAALLRLTERQRTTVVLHHLGGWSHAEVGAALGIATGTVAATLHQARARLEADLRPLPADPAASPTRPSIDGAPT